MMMVKHPALNPQSGKLQTFQMVLVSQSQKPLSVMILLEQCDILRLGPAQPILVITIAPANEEPTVWLLHMLHFTYSSQ